MRRREPPAANGPGNGTEPDEPDDQCRLAHRLGRLLANLQGIDTRSEDAACQERPVIVGTGARLPPPRSRSEDDQDRQGKRGVGEAAAPHAPHSTRGWCDGDGAESYAPYLKRTRRS